MHEPACRWMFTSNQSHFRKKKLLLIAAKNLIENK